LTSRLTGERPVPGVTPDSLLALHAAGYREVASRLGGGLVLDAGCGLGFQSVELSGPGRTVVGVDRDTGAASSAGGMFGHLGLRAACTDAARMGLRTGSFDFACSSHLVEHFDTPGRHVAEIARVLKPTGTAFFLTPNAPWDYENPFHLVLFRPNELSDLLREHFSEVWVGALDATPRVKEDFASRRAKAAKVLARLAPQSPAELVGGRVLAGVAVVVPRAGEVRLRWRDRHQCRRLLRDRRGRRRHPRPVRHRLFTEAAGLVVTAGR
jgi:SAM-dependent methyltransferase